MSKIWHLYCHRLSMKMVNSILNHSIEWTRFASSCYWTDTHDFRFWLLTTVLRFSVYLHVSVQQNTLTTKSYKVPRNNTEKQSTKYTLFLFFHLTSKFKSLSILCWNFIFCIIFLLFRKIKCIGYTIRFIQNSITEFKFLCSVFIFISHTNWIKCTF